MSKTWKDNLDHLEAGLGTCLEGVKTKIASKEEEFKQREANLSVSLQGIDAQFKVVLEKADSNPGVKKSALKLTEEEKESFFTEMCTKIDG